MPLNRMHKSLLFLVLWVIWLPSSTKGLKHSFVTKRDSRSFIAPIGAPFGFNQGGCFGLDVFDFSLTVKRRRGDTKKPENEPLLDQVEAGFLLKRFKNEDAFNDYAERILSNSTSCVFDPFRTTEDDPLYNQEKEIDDQLGLDVGDIVNASTNGIYIPVRNGQATPANNKVASVMYTFKRGEEGLYFLIYQVCPKGQRKTVHAAVQSTFELDFHYKNYDFFGRDSYLPAGEMKLPGIFLYFSISYLVCFVLWVSNIHKIQSGEDGHFASQGGRPVLYAIHHLMSIVLFLKVLAVFFAAVRYHYIGRSGHAELWSLVYYTFTFLKGTFLFTVILLIGTGWSFVKPFLSDREKKIICLVLTLQVIDNVALVVMSHETEGERVYDDWSAVLHLVDILCCCAILIPIVWHVQSLQQRVDSQEGVASADMAWTLSKLKLFRSFYLVVVAYIYFTRIVVFLIATLLDYRHVWVRYFVTELATLVFYIVTGMSFRPMVKNPYLVVSKDEQSDDLLTEEEIELRPTQSADV